MVEQLFTTLGHAMEGSPGLALAAAFIWGILSLILSPCHLASLPLIVGFIDEQGVSSTKRAFQISFLFALGILISIALIGALTAAAGRMLGDIGGAGKYIVAGIFLLMGLNLLGVIPMPWSGAGPIGMKRRGRLAALILGLVFGIALGPCTFSFMAPILAMTFRLSGSHPAYGLLLLLTYGAGHCFIIVLAGACTEWVQRVLDWNRECRGARWLKNSCGILILLAALWMLYTV